MKRRHKTIRPARIMTLAAALAVLRLLAAAGSGGALAEFLAREGTAELILGMELPHTAPGAPARPFYAAFLPGYAAPPPAPDASGSFSGDSGPLPEDSPPLIIGPHRAVPHPAAEPPGEPPEGENSGYSESGGSSEGGIAVRNNSGLDFDLRELLSEPLGIKLKPGEPSVLIIHTHSSEAYTRSPGETYEESDRYRTEDKEHSIIRVGDELASALSGLGLRVVHDRELYDYPSYAGSYGRSLEASKRYLEKYPSIALVIDLHRDAIAAADGSQYKTIADIDGELCSQIMLVVGTDGTGLNHPGWRENLKFALRLQGGMNRSFPTLARPVTVAKHRYNQHLTPGSLIVEVGAAGNTLSESITAVRFFAETYAAVVKEFFS
ncbi:MAG: stage II sporulation protein P [Oscillospiraceae bacterium]|nr:stage II sporulation protein P [Oscillospiraceae bacterium]